MIRKLLVFTLTLVTTAGFSQITIDSSDFGGVGDVIRTAQDTQVVGMNISAGSATAQTWDFTNLTAHVVDSAQFLDPATTPGAAEFPNASLALLQDGQYAYLTKTAGYLDLVGLYGDLTGQGIVLPIKPTPAQRNLTFPSTLGTSFTSNSIVDSTIEDVYTGIFDSLRLKRVTSITSSIDAFGSLTTPADSYTDVLRQEFLTTNLDTIWGYNSFLGSWSQVTTLVGNEYAYRFIAEDQDFYVLELQADAAVGQIQTARYQLGNNVNATGTVVDVACNGDASGAINQNVFGGVAPYSYQWSNGATTKDVSGLMAGVYTVTIYDQTDSTMNTYTISEPSAITATETVIDETLGADGEISLAVSGGTSPYTYQWSSGENTKDIAGLSTGSYTVTITDANACDAIFTAIVGDNTATANLSAEESLRVFPNPVSNEVTVKMDVVIDQLMVYALTGNQVISIQPNQKEVRVNLSALPSGVYFVHVLSNSGQNQAIKITKN